MARTSFAMRVEKKKNILALVRRLDILTATFALQRFVAANNFKGVIMKKTEKIISALLTIALGVLLIVLQGKIISIMMTIMGIALLIFGALDLYNRLVPPAIVKIVIGVVIIFCGWLIVGAVLYVLAAILLIAGILFLYEKIKNKVCGASLFYTICEYAVPSIFILIGILLLFNQGNTVNWVFILSGIFTVVEGGLLLLNALSED